MGNFVSKRKRMDLIGVPQGPFSVAGDVAQQYPCQEEGTVGANGTCRAGSEINLSMEWETPKQASEHQNSRQSIYSTMDAVPHLEFYTNSIGHQRRSRPSLESLRKVSEVSNLLATSFS